MLGWNLRIYTDRSIGITMLEYLKEYMKSFGEEFNGGQVAHQELLYLTWMIMKKNFLCLRVDKESTEEDWVKLR